MIIHYDERYSYEIYEDGYDIFMNGKRVITQRDPYGKLYKKDGTYEENALLHLKAITTVPEPEPTVEEQLRADVDFIAMELGLDLDA